MVYWWNAWWFECIIDRMHDDLIISPTFREMSFASVDKIAADVLPSFSERVHLCLVSFRTHTGLLPCCCALVCGPSMTATPGFSCTILIVTFWLYWPNPLYLPIWYVLGTSAVFICSQLISYSCGHALILLSWLGRQVWMADIKFASTFLSTITLSVKLFVCVAHRTDEWRGVWEVHIIKYGSSPREMTPSLCFKHTLINWHFSMFRMGLLCITAIRNNFRP